MELLRSLEKSLKGEILLKWMVCSPVFDDVTRDCYAESREVLQYMRGKGVEVYDLGGRPLSRGEVEKFLRENPEVNFAFFNHGSRDVLWGNVNQPVIDLDNVGLLRGREVFASACLSGKVLGVEAYMKGCKAYFGYRDVVIYTSDVLDVFREAFNYPIKLRLNGKNWDEAYVLARRKMSELVEKLVKMGKPLAAMSLRHDRDCMVCYTEKNPPKELEKHPKLIKIKMFFYKIIFKFKFKRFKYKLMFRKCRGDLK